jgi:hypothetical protein
VKPGVGLSRAPEPFHRVYSPPDPPAATRRPRRLRLLLAVVAAVAVAGALVFVVLRSGGGPADPTAQTPPAVPPAVPSAVPSSGTPEPTESTEPSPGPTSPPPPGERLYTALPPACQTVSQETVRRLVPNAKPMQSANQTFASCSYSATPDSGFRWLRVESRLYAPAFTSTPLEDAERLFGVQWSLARRATEERTIRLEPARDLGDEAYRWFKIDERQPTAIGVVAVRQRNVVITVSYSEQTARTSQLRTMEQRLLAQAAGAAGEVLADLR